MKYLEWLNEKEFDWYLNLEEKYHNMVSLVNKENYAKCILEISDLREKDLSMEVIRGYLHTWARNKYHYYKKMDAQLSIEFNDISEVDYASKEERLALYKELIKDYPLYAPWLIRVRQCERNDIDSGIYVNTLVLRNEYLAAIYNRKIEQNMKITSVFKRILKAPEELINRLAAVYEIKKTSYHQTLSIDPVDILTASENNHNWKSCYSFHGSHSDGTVVMMLDSGCAVQFLWKKKEDIKAGDVEIEDTKVKRLRRIVAFNETFTAVHTNKTYAEAPDRIPNVIKALNKSLFSWASVDEFKESGAKVNLITKTYGYEGEFKQEVFTTSDNEESIVAHNAEIDCPCGCGYVIPGSGIENYDEDYIYLNRGMNCDSYLEDSWYCEYCDDYFSNGCNCDCC